MNRTVYICLGLFALLVSFAPRVLAQEMKVVKDLRLWTGVQLEKSLGKDWTLHLEEEVRFSNNISEVNNYFTEFGLRYRIDKNFALGGAFRYTRDREDDGQYEPLTRYHFDLRYRRKLDLFTLSYRLRYQREVEGSRLFDADARNEKLFRNRLGVKLTALDKLEPFITVESFQEISPYVVPGFLYWRLVTGITYEPGAIGEFKLGWGFNREIGQLYPAMIYMFRLNYTYTF